MSPSRPPRLCLFLIGPDTRLCRSFPNASSVDRTTLDSSRDRTHPSSFIPLAPIPSPSSGSLHPPLVHPSGALIPPPRRLRYKRFYNCPRAPPLHAARYDINSTTARFSLAACPSPGLGEVVPGEGCTCCKPMEYRRLSSRATLVLAPPPARSRSCPARLPPRSPGDGTNSQPP